MVCYGNNIRLLLHVWRHNRNTDTYVSIPQLYDRYLNNAVNQKSPPPPYSMQAGKGLEVLRLRDHLQCLLGSHLINPWPFRAMQNHGSGASSHCCTFISDGHICYLCGVSPDILNPNMSCKLMADSQYCHSNPLYGYTPI